MMWQATIGSALAIEAYAFDGVPDAAPTVQVYDSDAELLWTATSVLDTSVGTVTGSRLSDQITVDGVGTSDPPTLAVGRRYWVATSSTGKGQVVTVTDDLGADTYEITPRLRTALSAGHIAGLRMSATIPATVTGEERIGCVVLWSWELGGSLRALQSALDIVTIPFVLTLAEADLIAVDPEYAEQAGSYELTWRSQASSACADVESVLRRHTTRLDQLGAAARAHAKDCAVLRALYLRYVTVPELRAHYDIRYQARLRDLVTELVDSHVAGTDDLAEVIV